MVVVERKVHARNAKGYPICGAKTKNGKYPICHKPPVSDNGRCHNHGGNSPGRPIIHGRRSMKGRYARILEGSNLENLYAGAIESNNLLDLKETAALLETVLQRVTQRATKFDSTDFRKTALDLFNQWHDLDSTDPDAARAKLLELGADPRRQLRGKDCFALAKESGDKRIQELLERRSPRPATP